MEHAYAVILAGGSGERFCCSAQRRPKFHFLFGDGAARWRSNGCGLIPPDRIFIITAQHLVENTAEAAWNCRAPISSVSRAA